MRSFAWILGLAAVLGISSPAYATEDAVGTTSEPATTHWYGWQTLLGELPAVAAFTLAGVTDNDSAKAVLLPSSLALYLTVSPAIHLGHHRPSVAAMDLAARAGTPLLGAGIGLVVAMVTFPDRPCRRLAGAGPMWDVPASVSVCVIGESARYAEAIGNGVVWGAAIGAAVATAIDALLLAREKVEPSASARRGAAWTPTFERTNGGGTIGVAGQF